MPIVGKTILLVEDEALLAMNEARQLKDVGYAVLLAGSGERAVEVADSYPGGIDLILMDINLGKGIDGTEAAQEILERHDVPILFLSSHTEPEIVKKTEMITNYGYVVKSSAVTVLDASIKMAFKLFKAQASIKSQKMELEVAYEEMQVANDELLKAQYVLVERETALRASEKRMRTMFEQAPLGLALVDSTGGLIYEANAKLVEISGRENEAELAAAGWIGIVHPEDVGELFGGIARLNAREEEAFTSGLRLLRPDGSLVWTNTTIAPIRMGGGAEMRLLCMVQDVTERRRVEEELKESEEKFKSLVKGMQVGVLLQGPEAEILLCNPRALELLGLSEDQLLGKTSFDPDWNVVHADGMPFPGETHPVPRAIATRESVRNEIMGVARAREGDRVWLSVDAVPFIGGDGAVLQVVCTFTDITERKRAEDKVQGLLREKEIILKEVHHRIKNNMSVVGSLLSVQAEALGDERSRTVLLDAASRVQSMMVLYDKLYRSRDSYSLSAKEYFPALIDEIAGIFPVKEGIRIDVEIEDILLGAKLLTPLGIILNELITNSMKYAFAGRSCGAVTISLRRMRDGVALEFGDDGIGFQPRAEGTKASGFGMQLIDMLVGQIGGTCSIEGAQGLKYRIEFKA
jgi:PAS domain S-box-containing protein